MPAKQLKPQRVALVIGNSAYTSARPLTNPIKDAQAVHLKLKSIGFEIVGGITEGAGGLDLNYFQMVRLIGDFLGRVVDGGHAVIYYAGHGIQVAGRNYLVPVDATLSSPDPRQDQLVELNDLISKAARRAGPSGRVVVFSDACRDDPFDGEQLRAMAGRVRSIEAAAFERKRTETTPKVLPTVISSGFSTPKLDNDDRQARTFIAFATAPGEVAYDGYGANSPFTMAVCQHMDTRGLDIERFYDRVQKDVREHVHSELSAHQDPWSESNLDEDFFLRPATWRPVVEVGIGGIIAGLVTGLLLFDPDPSRAGQIRRVAEDWWVWGLGLPYALLVAWASLRWGSGRRDHALFALVGSMISFAVAVSVLQTPVALRVIEQAGSGAFTPDFDTSSLKITLLALLAGILVGIGRMLQLPRSWSIISRVSISILSGLMTMGVLWLFQALLTIRDRPALIAYILLALISGLALALGTALACKPQLSVFRGFSSATGALTVGLTLPLLFISFTLMPTFEWVVILSAIWFGLLGLQLGYCFRYYVLEHRRFD